MQVIAEWNNINRSPPLFPGKFLEVKGQQSDLIGKGQGQRYTETTRSSLLSLFETGSCDVIQTDHKLAGKADAPQLPRR